MADVALTVADVLSANPSGTALYGTGIAGATITAGQSLYIDTANNNVLKPANAASSAPANGFAGVALHASLTGQPIKYVKIDPNFIFGGAGTVGEQFYLSPNNAGGITATFADFATGNNVICLGICNLAGAAGTATMNLLPTVGGIHA